MKRLLRFIKNKGYAAITATIFMLVISLTTISAFTFFTLQEVNTNRAYVKSIDSHYISESGIEDAIYRIITQKQIDSSEIIGVGNGSTTVTVTSSGNDRVITSKGARDAFQHNLETTLSITTQGVSFFYGAQVGEGGLDMKNNSSISGSVYSHGPVIGSAGAVITGDAFVAVGTPPVINQSWETQNADFPVGTAAGSITTLVDSVGDVGSYDSIAMGSDGFARISYYDATNKDMKFVRCTNADCTTKNITAVDTSGDVGQFSSMALGSDGFARISYYAISGGNLKFAQCTNADCTTKNITAVDTSGDIGKYTSTALDSSGFAVISYQDETNDDLKFARCLNDACSSFAITTVDSAGDVGSLKTAVAVAPDGFARISYFDDTNDDLKFAQCTNANCTAKIITIVESSGNIGKYQAMKLGSDGFARIAYYGDGDVHFARCSDNSCMTKTISAPDASGSDIGHYNSLAIGNDGFARISHYDNVNGDLRFIVCLNDVCSPANPQIDAAQSFQPTISSSISQIELYLKKVGAPANATMRLIRDSAGSPSTNLADVLATTTINASTIGVSYTWVTLLLSVNPDLTAHTTYWIVIDSLLDNANYFVWGFDAGAGYTRGSPKRTVDWTTGGWINVQGDLNFRAYMGGMFPPLKNVTVGGKAHAHIMDSVTVGGKADTFTLINGVIGGNVNANSITDCTVGGNASYNFTNNCVIIGSQTTPTTPPADLPSIPMPLSDAQIQEWKNAAAAGGVISGDVVVSGLLSLGPKKITGKLTITNGATLIVTGTLWVVGDVVFDNNSIINLTPSYGAVSGVIISDAKIDVKNNAAISGSGNPLSFMMVIAAKDSIGEEIINVDNNSQGIIYYANRGWIKFSNNATAKEAVAYGIRLDNNATLIYDAGLADAMFSSGPSGGYNIQKWKEVQ